MTTCDSRGCGGNSAPPTSAPPHEMQTDAASRSALAIYRIENMDCPTEEVLIRDKLAGMQGVAKLEFNLIQRTLSVHHELPSLAPVEQALAAMGMYAVRTDETAAEQATKLSIQAMDCPSEEALIRAKLVDVPGVSDLDFNLVQRTLTVHHASGVLPNVLATLKTINFDARVIEPAETSGIPAPAQTKWWPLAISGVTAVAAEIMYWFHDGNHWSVITLALIAILTGGLPTYNKGWIAIKNRNLNMNALMSIAVTGAVLIGHWPEAAMVMVLFALAETPYPSRCRPP